MNEKPVVVKIGGSTLGEHDTSLADLATLHHEGRRFVVIHGGGAMITKWLGIHDIESRFVRGLRATDERAMEVVAAVLAGVVNKRLAAQLNALGARAIGLAGADAAIVGARRYDDELGLVGKIVAVDARSLNALLDAGFLPVIAPIAIEVGMEGLEPSLLNINADTAAGEIARAIGAERLVLLTDVDGVMDGAKTPLPMLSAQSARSLISTGAATGGMIPKLESALGAAALGVPALIVNGTSAHSLRRALSGEAIGTLIEPDRT